MSSAAPLYFKPHLDIVVFCCSLGDLALEEVRSFESCQQPEEIVLFQAKKCYNQIGEVPRGNDDNEAQDMGDDAVDPTGNLPRPRISHRNPVSQSPQKALKSEGCMATIGGMAALT
ncbi:hypothetical protein NLI96_g9084 [Meripilus lineatus]|uniref:Uncharacterized protein n=1 Tax=Meripilus lineatus TaxID=2056292 RepID=A0AAD5YBD9_9APHY|nr:hypothetical protein NLI96_g9084 [Physisporinus lineatus]